MTAPRVVVVGGGITGLTAAYRLVRSGSPPGEVLLLEAADRLGGKLHTSVVDGMPVEDGADSFVLRKPWALDLARELGLEEELVVPGAEGAFVWAADGRLIPFPERSAFGVPARADLLLRWPGISVRGRLRALTDLLRPAGKGVGDVSLSALVRRRLGEEAATVLVEPLLAGIHAGDPDRMSVPATFPELLAWDQGHGSLLRGAKRSFRSARGEQKPIFGTVWSGLSRLVQALEEGVGPDRIRVGASVTGLGRSSSGYLVETGGQAIDADAIVMAIPAFEASRLLSRLSPEAARELAAIPYASTAVITLIYPEGTADRLPGRTGIIVPPDSRRITACTWVSRKWPREEYGRRAIVRCYVGRAGDESDVRMPEGDLVELVHGEVQAATPLGSSPEHSRVIRWPRSMPQYEVGHLERLTRLERGLAELPGIFLAGSAYRGVGIADCVRQANEAAGDVIRHLEALASVLEGAEHPQGSNGARDRKAITWPT